MVAEDIRSQAQRHVNSCYFTMVAVDDDGRPIAVPMLEPGTEKERERFDEAVLRKKLRLEMGTRSTAS